MNKKNKLELPDMIGATLPERENRDKIQKLCLKYPTKHLLGFEELRESTRLFGDEYIVILKALWYGVMSCITSEVTLNLGQIKTDGRIHLLIVLKSGKGKREIKRVTKAVLDGLNKAVEEPTSLHPEQLVGKTFGKIVQKEMVYYQFGGYLSRDYLLFDEGRDLLTADDPIHTESRRYLRLAQDPYPYNQITKKAVNVPFGEELKYTPYVGTCIFTQPYHFNEDFVTDGDLRRYIVPYVNMSRTDRTDAYDQRVDNETDGDKSLNSFIGFLNSLDRYKSFKLSSDVVDKFKQLSKILIRRGFSHSTKVHNFMDLCDFTIQDMLLKMCAVQAMQDQNNVINKNHLEMAFVDLLEFYEHMYEFITIKINGMMDYGEGWLGITGKDREILQWLNSEGAVSKEGSNISIKEYESKIEDIYGVKDRRTRDIKKKHESKSWIMCYKAPGISKVWLNFKPKSKEAIPAIEAEATQEIYDGIIEKLPDNTAPIASITTIDMTKTEPVKVKGYADMDLEELKLLALGSGDPKAQEELEKRLLSEKVGNKMEAK